MLLHTLEINRRVAIPSPSQSTAAVRRHAGKILQRDGVGGGDGAAPDKETLTGTKSSKTVEK